MLHREMLDYVGDISQIGGIKRYQMLEGKAKGVEAVDVDDGQGLRYTILIDRGMDLGKLVYRDCGFTFQAAAGVTAPQYYNERGEEWLQSFGGGFLTTCGLTQAGDPCVFEGQPYGLHGQVSNLPARLERCEADWQGDDYMMEVAGRVCQTRHQGVQMSVRRSIRTALGSGHIQIEDRISNQSSDRSALMLLYHMNFGYPFLSPDTRMYIPARHTEGWDEFSKRHMEQQEEMPVPCARAAHYTYLHELRSDSAGNTGFMLWKERDDKFIGVQVRYNQANLPYLGQWMYPKKRDYIMALEPCNNHIKGTALEEQYGTLRSLEPQEEVTCRLDIRFFSTREKWNELKTELEALTR
ncbi:aldose 1-epimerase family protein [Diplocloster modestus]|uniref:Aldose 1-epimerase family protein n=1 Tax=Diplocloster modestus TaxID=2850322 RepID=A0ABS6KAS3_9FIRM|nr:aldose 1-epimerase family protein [Diplocloster modestus]MBU9727613.1 aldose 1-epimerase family protein [Diplocloster modestus]